MTFAPAFSSTPARVMHHFIQRYHGHVKLSFHYIADELGIG